MMQGIAEGYLVSPTVFFPKFLVLGHLACRSTVVERGRTLELRDDLFLVFVHLLQV